MKTGYTVVDGSQFDAGVIPPGPLQPAPPEPKRELSDQYMAVLSNMLFERDMLSEKERSEIQQLVGERHSLNQRASEIIERFQACTHARVAAEHELAKQAVRDQMALIDKHRGEVARDSRGT